MVSRPHVRLETQYLCREILCSLVEFSFLPRWLWARFLSSPDVLSRAMSVGQNQSDQEFTARLERIRQRFDLPALGAVIVANDRTLALGATGICKAGQEKKIDADVHWQLGSITKTINATLIARLIEQKKLRWTSTLGEIFPEWKDEMAAHVAGITVRQLVLHQSGMGTDVVPWQGSPETNQPGMSLMQRRAEFVHLALKQALLFVPGTQKTYSNQGYNVLGGIADRVTGQAWEKLIASEICDPLGIGSVVFGEPALAEPESEPWPHVWKDGRCVAVAPIPESFTGFHLCNPAGGISLTLADFALWMRAHLDSRLSADLLSPESMRVLHTSEAQGGISPFGIGNNGVGLGRSLNHNGCNGRNYAEYSLLPDKNLGVFFATNVNPPPHSLASWFVMNTLFATALPGQWPLPALDPPAISPTGTVEGEALEIVSAGSGGVEFQRFGQLSGRFQLWWYGAQDGETLVLRAQAARAGRYRVDGIFAGNNDFGAATIEIGGTKTRLDFKNQTLEWGTFQLGESVLTQAPCEIRITAHGSSGTASITCHAAIDALRFQYLGPA